MKFSDPFRGNHIYDYFSLLDELRISTQRKSEISMLVPRQIFLTFSKRFWKLLWHADRLSHRHLENLFAQGDAGAERESEIFERADGGRVEEEGCGTG